MAIPQPRQNERYTYADYLAWPDDDRWELIDGVPYAMSPAPVRRHQGISIELCRQIANHLLDKPCKVYDAPFDVRLSEQTSVSDNYIDTVVQPDILVVCDESKLDERGCNGAPDLIIEILSQSTAAHDVKTKYELYQRYGVKEYWIVYPAEHVLMINRLGSDGKYSVADRYAQDDMVPVPLLGDLLIDLDRVFAE